MKWRNRFRFLASEARGREAEIACDISLLLKDGNSWWMANSVDFPTRKLNE